MESVQAARFPEHPASPAASALAEIRRGGDGPAIAGKKSMSACRIISCAAVLVLASCDDRGDRDEPYAMRPGAFTRPNPGNYLQPRRRKELRPRCLTRIRTDRLRAARIRRTPPVPRPREEGVRPLLRREAPAFPVRSPRSNAECPRHHRFRAVEEFLSPRGPPRDRSGNRGPTFPGDRRSWAQARHRCWKAFPDDRRHRPRHRKSGWPRWRG